MRGLSHPCSGVGINASKATTKGLLGFTIYKTAFSKAGKAGKETTLAGGRVFRKDDGKQGRLRSDAAPIQAFMWSDYSADPGTKYRYRVVPVYGSPGALEPRKGVQVMVTTEALDDGVHGIFFNRGVAGSQAYSRKFGKYERYYPDSFTDRKTGEVTHYAKPYIKPEDVPDGAAYRWLSRGLEEAMLDFIAQAKDETYSLRAAVYEFTHDPAAQAFLDALERGADVKILHHAPESNAYSVKRKGRARYDIDENGLVTLDPNKLEVHQVHEVDGITQAANATIDRLGLKDKGHLDAFNEMFIPRVNTGAIAHNKFIVLLKDGKPIQVWTGSTNYTAGGIYGQSNVGHIVRDEAVAARYLAYWDELHDDPELKEMQQWNVDQQPDLEIGEAPDPGSITAIFSPRPKTRNEPGMLEWYADRFASAKSSVHFTVAFSVAQQLFEVLEKPSTERGKDPFLRYILMENITSAGVKKKYPVMKDVAENKIAYGATFKRRPEEDQLLEALTGLNEFVDYLHTKYVLIDALTDDPIVITGSANFSDASTNTNDENMLIIRGNTRVADIEFMRLFNHFRFRNELNELGDAEFDEQTALDENDSWTKPYYTAGSQEMEERLLYG